MRNLILESRLNEELKNKMVALFDITEKHVNDNVAETNFTTRKIYTPIEITFNADRIVRVGIVNESFFAGYKDLKLETVEFEKEDFNQFDENGLVEGLIPMNLSNDKEIIFMPGIHIPMTDKEDLSDIDIFKTVDYRMFFN